MWNYSRQPTPQSKNIVSGKHNNYETGQSDYQSANHVTTRRLQIRQPVLPLTLDMNCFIAKSMQSPRSFILPTKSIADWIITIN